MHTRCGTAGMQERTHARTHTIERTRTDEHTPLRVVDSMLVSHTMRPMDVRSGGSSLYQARFMRVRSQFGRFAAVSRTACNVVGHYDGAMRMRARRITLRMGCVCGGAMYYV